MFDLRPVTRRNNSLYFDPFKDMADFERKFFGNDDFFRTNSTGAFRTDISDNGDSYLLESDLPGFDKEDIKLDIDGDVLTISAEHRTENEEKDKHGKYIRCERSYGSYSRAFDVSGVDMDNAKAKYENGVLKLTLPKKQTEIPESKRLMID